MEIVAGEVGLADQRDIFDPRLKSAFSSSNVAAEAGSVAFQSTDQTLSLALCT